MRPLVLAACALLALVSSALSQRPSTLGMTCAEARALVKANGAVVLSTGQYTYDRYVEHAGYCMRNERRQVSYVPTRDGKCQLYNCKARFRDEMD